MESEQYDWVTFDDDEDIIWTGKPRVAAVIKTALFTMFLPVGAYFYSGIGAAGIALLIAVGITVLSYLGIQNTDYVLTNKRLYRKTGVLSEQTESAPLNKIQNTSLSKDIIGSWRGFGTVSISTAAGAGDISIKNINDPSDLKRLLSKQTASATADASSEQDPISESDVGIDELTDEVKRFRENIEDFNKQTGNQ